MAWRPQSAAPVVHQPEGFGGAPFRSRAYDQEGGLPPPAGARPYAARLPILARMRSYSGVQRSGMISASGLTIRREGNPTAAGIEARGLDLHDAKQCRQLARVRQSLMARREPQREHFRR